MGDVMSLTPFQQFFILGIYAWIFVIFPIIVLHRLKYISDLLEAQFDSDGGEDVTNEGF